MSLRLLLQCILLTGAWGGNCTLYRTTAYPGLWSAGFFDEPGLNKACNHTVLGSISLRSFRENAIIYDTSGEYAGDLGDPNNPAVAPIGVFAFHFFLEYPPLDPGGTLYRENAWIGAVENCYTWWSQSLFEYGTVLHVQKGGASAGIPCIDYNGLLCGQVTGYTEC